MPAKVGPCNGHPLNLWDGTVEGVTIVVESYILRANGGPFDGIPLVSLRLGRRTDGTILDVSPVFSPANVGPFDGSLLVSLKLDRRTDGAMLDVCPNVTPSNV